MKRVVNLVGAALLTAGPVISSGAESEIHALRQALSAHLPPAVLQTLSPTPVSNLYQVVYAGQVVYVSSDGRYVLRGRLIDLETREDLTERVLSGLRLRALEEIPEERMIIFEPEGEVRHTVTTFTDIDCPYCRKMHSEMTQINGYGIRVRYMLFPRAGKPSVSYDKAVSVWCAPDRREEMTRAKRGTMPEKRDCANPVDEHMALALRLGLQGTPFTITDSGRAISGYMPAEELYDALEADKRGVTLR